MTAIVSVLAVVLSALWYYRTAESKGQPAIAWALAGAMIYYGGFLIWMHGILKLLLGGYFQAHGLWIGIGMDVSATVFGLLMVFAFRQIVLIRKGAP